MPLCHRSTFALLVLGLLAPGLLPAQEPYLVKDINTQTERERGLASHEVLATSAGLFYSFDDSLHGPELWRSDTSGANPSLVRDLCPGSCGSLPHDLAELDGVVYFFADDGVTGPELWRTDGTTGGTTLVRDLCPGSCPGRPDAGASPRRLGDALFFRARGADGQVELWTSDGTNAGTRPVADICPGCSAGIFDLTVFGDALYFRADDGVHGLELWSSDGVTAALLRDDCPGTCSYSTDLELRDLRNLFTPSGGDLFYWERVPGPSAQYRLRSIAGAAGPAVGIGWPFPRLVPFGNAFVFTAGNVLATIDFATLSPVIIYRFQAADTSYPTVGSVVALGGSLFFIGVDRDHGYELWRSDGTVAGTQLAVDTVPGPDSGGGEHLAVVDGKLFFVSRQGTLRVSDGTAAGTRSLGSVPPPVASSTPDPAGKRLLVTTGSTPWSAELWAAEDLPSSGVRSVRAIQSFPGSAGLRDLIASGGTLFFGAREGGDRHRLWRSDGTPGGTAILSPSLVTPEDVALFQGGVVFRDGIALWKTDGTAAGTRRILPSFAADGLQVIGDRLFLSGYSGRLPDAFTGNELWISDGTVAGTRLVKDIVPGGPAPDGTAPGSRPRQVTLVGSTLFFVAETPELGAELWSSDGTPEGTALHAELCSGPCSSDLHLLASFAGRLFFTAATRFDLLSSTPGQKGAFRLHRVGSSAPDPVVFQDRLFFFAEDALGHEHLWSSDGTAPGTVRVQEVSGPGQPRIAHEPIVWGGRLFFSGWSEAAGQELWESDGTAGGTQLFKDLHPGPESSDPRHLTLAGERLFFSANDGKTGQEPWATDGSAAGTRRLGDIAPGPASSAPADLTPAGNRLFFSADDGKTGRELWALDIPELYDRCVPGVSRLCLLDRRFEVTVRFVSPLSGVAKPGIAIPDSDQSGFFWFFAPGNLELVVKLLDGRAANGHVWVFFGALSDVEYTVTVTDRATGAVRTYHNPRGTFCGQADTAAFRTHGEATTSSRAVQFDPVPGTAAAAGSCVPGPNALCLGGGRFRVEARFKDQHGLEGTATAVPRTNESGTFWFFSPGNTELMVKVLDGTPVNGKTWIFYGALSDVEYWLTVTDTVTGAAKTYHNPPGTYCGRGDTAGL